MPPAAENDTGTAGVRGAAARLGYGIRANGKVGLAFLAVAAGAAWVGWGLLHQEAPAPPASRLDAGSEVASDLTVPTSPAYREAVEEGDTERRDEAMVEGESYVPTFQSQTPGMVVAAPVKPSALAPSAEAAQAAQAAQRARAPVTPQPEAEDAVLQQDYPVAEERGIELVRTGSREADEAAIGTMFEDLLTRWNEAPTMTVIRYDTQAHAAPAQAPPAGAQAAAGAGAAPGRVLVPAGRVLYAATSVGVDSELGLPVLVEVLEKPFRGALLRGEFRQVRERMVVQFSRLSDPRRDLELAVDAYAVGLQCQCGALSGEVDRHWFARVVLPAAFGFAQEYLRAAGEPDTRIVVDGEVVTEHSEDQSRARVARGLAGAADRAGSVLFESLPSRATVRLPHGMELGIVFVEPVRAEGRGQG